ncbi:LysR family transcriptional regulator [Micromonospora sp. AKA38]|nr:LysR family transcriptional regulator [Micromonospora sp. AKA38]
MSLQTIARELSFTRAARELHVSQPALSKRIRRLEQMLGFVLFDRSTAGMTLTPAGARLLAASARLMSAWSETLEQARALSHPLASRPEVRLAAFEHFDGRLAEHLTGALPSADITLSQAHPAEALTLLAEGAVDAAIVYELPDDPLPTVADVHMRTVVIEPQWIVLGRCHPLAGDAQVEVPAVSSCGTPWFVSPAGHPVSRWERTFLRSHDPAAELLDATDSSLRRIAAGKGAAMASPQNKPNELLVLLPLTPLATWRHHLLWRPEAVKSADVADALFVALLGFHQRQAQRHPGYWEWIARHPGRFPGVYPDTDGN